MNSTLLTSAELTALHTETVNDAREARTLANIARRAKTLIEDGYQIRAYEGTHFYEVTSPKGDRYSVWHGEKVGFECNCPAFEKYATCKHLQAIDLMKQDEADAAKLDAMEVPGYDVYEYRY